MNLSKPVSSPDLPLRHGTGFAPIAAMAVAILFIAGTGAALSQQTGDSKRAALDAGTESNVIVALDSSSALKNQQIAASTVDGDVTLTGMVSDEASKRLAEEVAARVSGVRSVANNLTVAAPVEPPDRQLAQEYPAQQPPQDQPAQDRPADQGQTANDPQINSQLAQGPDPAQQGRQSPNAPPQQAPQAAEQGNAPYPYPSGPAPRADDPDSGQNQNAAPTDRNGYPPSDRTPERRPPYNPGPYDQRGYDRQGPRYDDRQSRRDDNRNSGPVTLPASTMLRVRTSEFLDTRRLQPGSVFDVTAANDIFVARALVIPRGAVLQGVVTDVVANTSGSLKGSTSLTLKLTTLELEGYSYPLETELWTGEGPGKGAYSANNTIGGAAAGAVLGAIIGRGPGAAIGAVAGGATGAAASSASSGPQMVLAPETILTFHLAQSITVTPVSYREAQRLASAQPPGRPYVRQRRYYPPPPPPYYGPAYYGPNYGPSLYYRYGRPW